MNRLKNRSHHSTDANGLVLYYVGKRQGSAPEVRDGRPTGARRGSESASACQDGEAVIPSESVKRSVARAGRSRSIRHQESPPSGWSAPGSRNRAPAATMPVGANAKAQTNSGLATERPKDTMGSHTERNLIGSPLMLTRGPLQRAFIHVVPSSKQNGGCVRRQTQPPFASCRTTAARPCLLMRL